MSTNDRIKTLIARVDKTLGMLQRITAQYDDFLETDFPKLGKKNTSAIVVAEFLVDYYTCLETLFLRISQFFENSLTTDRWHADLLEKMTLGIEGVRIQAISSETSQDLSELMRFRHLRRYYFELQYDWDKLSFLQKKLNALRKAVPQDLGNFRNFLVDLSLERAVKPRKTPKARKSDP
jgi:hypothetical protein